MTGRPTGYDRDELSKRELEVIRLVATGMTNIQAGERLYVTEQTIKHHMGNVIRKLGVTNRTEAVWRAMELGLVDPPVNLDADVKGCPHCGKAYV